MMMKRIPYILLLAAAVIAGCKKDVRLTREQIEAKTGTLELQLSLGGEFRSRSAVSGTDEFSIAISREDDGWTKKFDRYADLPEELRLGAGKYTVTACSRDTLPAAFDQPIYKGSTEFEIVAGKLTPISVTCKLSNMKVAPKPSERLKSEFSDYRILITNAPSWNDAAIAEHQLSWDDKAVVDAGKPGYFTVAPLLVKVYGHRAVDGHEASAEFQINDVAACDYHIINIDAVATGQAGIVIEIDDSVNEKTQDIQIPGWEETPVDGHHEGDDPQGDDPEGPQTDNAPTMSWDANPDFAPTPVEDVMNINIKIDAPEKIAGFIINVDSYILSDVIAQLAGDTGYTYSEGNPYTMDLIGNATLVNVLGGMGVPTGDQLKGQSSVLFSLSELVPLIMMYSPESGSQHIFDLKVTDEKGQELEKTLVFYMP